MTEPGQLVWCPNAFRRDLLWPAVTVDLLQAPDYVRKLAAESQSSQAEKIICVCFYGTSIAQARLRDYYIVSPQVVVPWTDHKFEETDVQNVPDAHVEAFKAAHEEALGVEAGYLDALQGMMPKVDPDAPCCLNCGKLLKGKEVAAAKEQQDRCNDCQALYQAGQYCSVCNRVWFPYEAERLASCKRCACRIHAACDVKAAKAIQAVSAKDSGPHIKLEDEQQQQQQQLTAEQCAASEQQQLQLVPVDAQKKPCDHRAYNCPGCRQKLAEESQMDLLRLQAVLLADMRPTKPMAAAELFAVEYTRKHLAEGGKLDLPLLQGLISSAWLEEEAKATYEQRTAQQEASYKAALPQYEELFQQYLALAASQRHEIDISLALDPQRLLGPVAAPRGSLVNICSGANMAAALPMAGAPWEAPGRTTRNQQHQQLPPLPMRQGSGVPVTAAADGSSSAERLARSKLSVVGSGEVVKAEDGSDVPQEIPITCNNIKGTFLMADMKVVCSCTSCAVQPVERRTFTPTQYEQHAGCGSAKKWKASIRIEPGAVPECRKGSNAMAFGKWLDIKGIEVKGSKTVVRHDHHSTPAAEPPVLSGPAASVKRHSELLQQQLLQRGPSLPETGGPSPSNSSRGGSEAAAAGGGGDAGASSSGGVAPKPAGTTGIPRNRRPDTWAPWEDVTLGQYKPIEVKYAGDRCCVCDSDVDYDVDRLVSCDGCGITVHQSCYGIPELPDVDDMWLCRSCELKEPGAPEPQCCLCPLTGGGLKPTTLPGLWAHAACMQWIPEVTCIDPSRMEPIDRIQHIQKERWELLCCICRQRMGAKIQCNDCYQAYHPLCARRVGLHMEMAEPAVPDGPLQLVTFCPKHCTPQPHGSGITLLSLDDQTRIGRPRKRLSVATSSSAGLAAASAACNDDEANNTNGLWNAQPFIANRPPAPIPAAPGGCARAASFSAKQIQHGTGTGCTSTQGFWIPTEDTAAAAKASAAAGLSSEAGGPASSGTAAQLVAGAAAGLNRFIPSRKRKRGRPGGTAVAASAGRGSSSAVRKGGNKGPPPEVDLLPLPDGVPDRVPVVCNGRPGTLLVRPQRVLAGDQELTASRFEAMCGKGDAKKWKSSLWFTEADGEPVCCMGDWLSKRGLDKNALSKLAANWTAVEQRRLWEEQHEEEADADGTEVSRADSGAATTEADDDMTEVTGADETEQPDAAESESMHVDDGDSTTPSKQKADQAGAAAVTAADAAAAEGTDGEQQVDDGDMPVAKKQKLSDAESGEAVQHTAQDADDDVRLAHVNSNASAAMTTLPVGGQEATAQAGTGGGQEQRQPAANGIDSADVAASSKQPDSPETAVATAAVLRKQQGRILLQKLHYMQLPDSFIVHPASLQQEAAEAAAAARRKSAAAAGADAAALAAYTAAAAAEAAAAAGDSTAATPATLSADKEPWMVVGRCCRMYWPDDDAWYEADVTAFNADSKKHTLWYHIDEVREEIDLAEEERQGRVQWLPLVDKLKWPRAPKVSEAALQQQLAAEALLGLQADGMQIDSGANGAVAGVGMDVDGADEASDVEDEGPAAAVQIPPPNFPRLTAMHRDPSDGHSVDLVGISSRGAPVTEQLQLMVLQQQQQFVNFSRAQPPPGQAPAGQAAVGWRVGVFCGHVQMYYYGQITAYNAMDGMHRLQYDDGVQASISLQQEKLDWVAADGTLSSRAAQQVHAAYAQQCAAAAERQQRKQLRQQQRQAQRMQRAITAALAPGASQQQQQQALLMIQMQMQQVHSEMQRAGWQQGMLVPLQYQQRLQQLAAMRQQLMPDSNSASQSAAAPSQQQQQQQQLPQAAAAKPGPKPGAPTQIDVICGTNTGVFHCLKNAVTTENGRTVSPTEFERLSGKGSSKKWKCTIRVRKANGQPGITMGDWLIQMGYDQPKESKSAVEGAKAKASLNDIRKQQLSRKTAAAAAAAITAGAKCGSSSAAGTRPASDSTHVPGRGVALHRDGCMCVICKQARRKAAQEAGLAPAAHDAYVPRSGEGSKGPGSSRAAAYGGKGASGRSSSFAADVLGSKQAAEEDRRRVKLPSMLIGKRAYVKAVPHLIRGATIHKAWELPESNCYTPQEWEALQQGASSSPAAAAGSVSTGQEQPSASGATAAVHGGSRAGTPALDSRPGTPQLSDSAAVAALAADAGDGATSSGGADRQHEQQGAGGEKPEKRGSRTQTWRQKLHVCHSLENKRITFGKSGIHGWGIFARQPIEQDSMVTDFRGQLIRCILADVREVRYRKQARDCYMFHASDETVIDNTGCGNYSRFTNHCCAPCLYAKPLELGGELHLCFFAKTNIKAGQELTFDYRFKEEDSDSKVICQCGAPSCKGTLN